ncbi:unnamed protein product, partial [Trichogramma brassicae]
MDRDRVLFSTRRTSIDLTFAENLRYITTHITCGIHIQEDTRRSSNRPHPRTYCRLNYTRLVWFRRWRRLASHKLVLLIARKLCVSYVYDGVPGVPGPEPPRRRPNATESAQERGALCTLGHVLLQRSEGNHACHAKSRRRMDARGLRGTKARGGVSAGDELRGQVPEHLPHKEAAPPALGHCLPAARLEAARAKAHLRRGARLLHRQFHHTARALEVGTAGRLEAQMGFISGDSERFYFVHFGTSTSRFAQLGHEDDQTTREDLHRLEPS